VGSVSGLTVWFSGMLVNLKISAGIVLSAVMISVGLHPHALAAHLEPLSVYCTGRAWNVVGGAGGRTIDTPVGVELNFQRLITVRGTDNRLYTSFYSLDYLKPNPYKWSEWVKDPVGESPNAVAMVRFNNLIYQAVRGLSDSKIYTRYSSDGQTWSDWVKDETSYTSDALAMTVFKNKIYQAARGSFDRIYTRSSADGINWSNWSEAGGFTPNAVAMSAFNNKLYQAVRGNANNRIFTRTSVDGENWEAWEEDPTSYTPGAVAMTPIRITRYNGINNYPVLFQVARGTGNQIFYRFMMMGEGWRSWRNQVQIPCTNQFVPTVLTYSSPSLFQQCWNQNIRDYGCASILVRGTDNSILEGMPVIEI
jgi:hypothetical protein